MYRISYEMIIKAIENNDTESLIGSIDLEVIKKEIIQSLYYELPLIERLVLEICKLLPLSDVECYKQGTMRTPIEMLNKGLDKYLPYKLIDLLHKYFAENGLRNKLFHTVDDIGNVTIKPNELDFQEIKFMIMQLTSILKNKCGKYSVDSLGKIELLK